MPVLVSFLHCNRITQEVSTERETVFCLTVLSVSALRSVSAIALGLCKMIVRSGWQQHQSRRKVEQEPRISQHPSWERHARGPMRDTQWLSHSGAQPGSLPFSGHHTSLEMVFFTHVTLSA